MRKIVGVALICCAGWGCSDDTAKPDAAVQQDSQVGQQDTAVQQDGAGQPDVAVKADAPVKTDASVNAWSCTQKPGGGPFSTPHSDGCKWEWTCASSDDRQLYCETISTKEHTCDCKNLTTGKVEKTFKSVPICTFSNATIAAEANKHCGWKLP